MKNLSNFYVKYSEFIISSLFLLLCLLYIPFFGEVYNRPGSDPDVLFVLNSILILEGEIPCNVDQPGTTMQIFGAVLYKLIYSIRYLLFEDIASLSEDIIQYDTIYATIQRLIIIIFISVAQFFFLREIKLHLSKILSSISFAVVLFLSPWAYSVCSISGNSFAVLASIFFMMFVTKSYLSKKTLSTKEFIFLAAITGFGLASKFIFIFIIPSLLLIPSLNLKKFARFWGFTIIFLMLFTLPISSKYTESIDFVLQVLKGHGAYGTSEAEFDVEHFWNNLISILVGVKRQLFIVLLGFSAMIHNIFFKTNDENHHLSKSLKIYLLILLVASPIVAKHGARSDYFVVIYPLLVLSSVYVVFTFKRYLKYEFSKRLIIGFFIFYCSLFIKNSIDSYKNSQEFNNRVKNNYIRGTGFYDKYSSYYTANHAYSCSYFTNDLQRLYPSAEFFSGNSAYVVDWGNDPLRKITRTDTVIRTDWKKFDLEVFTIETK